MNHECVERFLTEKKDNCSGEAYNKCYGISPMNLEVWFMDTNGIEEYCDGWQEMKVKFCPFCGLKSQEVKQ